MDSCLCNNYSPPLYQLSYREIIFLTMRDEFSVYKKSKYFAEISESFLALSSQSQFDMSIVQYREYHTILGGNPIVQYHATDREAPQHTHYSTTPYAVQP